MLATGTPEMKRIQLEAREKKAKKDDSAAKAKKRLEAQREKNKKRDNQRRKGGKSAKGLAQLEKEMTEMFRNEDLDDDYDHCEENFSDIEEVEKEVDFDKVEIGHYVLIEYEGELFPGKVIDKGDMATVSCMTVSGGNWKWPKDSDEAKYHPAEIKRMINTPKALTSRGTFEVPELRGHW